MNDIRKSFSMLTRAIMSLMLLIFTIQLLGNSESKVITTIILINRQAELVDMDTTGEILKRYLAIPDYFSSGRSHNSSLRQSLLRIKDYGQLESFFLPGSSTLPAKCLQSSMLAFQKKKSQDHHPFALFSIDQQEPSKTIQSSRLIVNMASSKGITNSEKREWQKKQTLKHQAQISFAYSIIPLQNYKQRIKGPKRLRQCESWFT